MARAEFAQYGGITVMFPIALIIAIWLWRSRSKALGLWGGTVFAGCSIVAISKLLFKGWGVALESVDIAVISGHAMNTCLMVTVALSLIARQVDRRLRWPAAFVGMLATAWFSVCCVAPYIHPRPEAVAGAMLGITAACFFLWRLEYIEDNKVPLPLVGGGLVILLLSAMLPKYNAEGILNQVAITISGAQQAFQEPLWRASSVRPVVHAISQ